uniref:Myb/SANT-like domain-containing protein n=1 Tax=Lactuca sativa TaxID=4236 RepID=A0A9R1XHG6_LACSA|nr:hypothetical protein LSAT_V11C400169690 [Lactuca sativa]
MGILKNQLIVELPSTLEAIDDLEAIDNQVMDTTNVHDVGIDTPKLKVTNRFNWDPHTFKTACRNICKRLLERTCKDLDINQMKNKWDIMRKEFKYYDHKEYAKFKDKSFEVYETYYEALFRDTVVVGDKAKVPYEFGDNSTPDDVQFVDITDGKEASDEVLLFDDVDPFLTYDSSSKKRMGKKLTPRRDNKRKFEGKSMVSSSYEEKMDTVFDVLLTRCSRTPRQTTHSPTTKDCMAIVSTFLGNYPKETNANTSQRYEADRGSQCMEPEKCLFLVFVTLIHL